MLPHQMNSASVERASTATRRDQTRSPGCVRSRREGMASRSTRLGKPASASDASPRLAGRDDQRAGRIAPGQLGHPARDARRRSAGNRR